MKAYLANSLFSQADFNYNQLIAEYIRAEFPELDLYLPQENDSINDKSNYANSVSISRADDEELLSSDFLIAVIDGGDVDSGVACEIGKIAGYDSAHQLYTGDKPRPIFALYTDIRQNGRDNKEKIDALIEDGTENQFTYRNLYVVGTIKDSGGSISYNIAELVHSINKFTLDF